MAKAATKSPAPANDHDYRVVYGETRPMWERTFATLGEAATFAIKHEGFGDIIFSIAKIVPGKGPRGLQAQMMARANGKQKSRGA